MVYLFNILLLLLVVVIVVVNAGVAVLQSAVAVFFNK